MVSLKSVTVRVVSSATGGHVVVIESDNLALRCDKQSEFCHFNIRPFYHGRVMGLWGTFSGEVADDLTLPNGEV